jgi:hypothetical protein
MDQKLLQAHTRKSTTAYASMHGVLTTSLSCVSVHQEREATRRRADPAIPRYRLDRY